MMWPLSFQQTRIMNLADEEGFELRNLKDVYAYHIMPDKDYFIIAEKKPNL